MKKILIISLTVLALFACKKTEFSPEGPTDVRIRNISDATFNEVIMKTSEKEEDVDTIGTISANSLSDYFRFEKAYPKAEITAEINIGGVVSTYSTGSVDFTYMQYIGQDRITYEVWISNPSKKELSISNVIVEEPLILE
ncbi:MAG TPA: hypothetical protein VMV77_11670 [Bacteroidales bacterium]|nr:hypothetical protein [Bacteroidales bacterium]